MDITVIAIDNHREDLLKIQTILKSISKISAKHLCFYISFYDNPKAIVSYECDWFIIGIQLDGVSGFEAAQKCREMNPTAKIIFYSEHSDLVFKSFDLNVFFFIRKHYIFDDLIRCTVKYEKLAAGRYIYIENGNITPIPLDSILYFEVTKNDLYIHLRSNKELYERKSMKQLLETVPKGHFVQPSVNFLVNCVYIEYIRNNTIIMKNGLVFPIIKKRILSVQNTYLSFLALFHYLE